MYVHFIFPIYGILTLFQIRGEGGGRGETDSTRLQIVFFMTSVRDTAEPRNLMIFPKI